MATLTSNKEAMLRLVLQTGSEAVLLLDGQGTILGASLRLTDLLGTSWQDLQDKPFSSLAPPELNSVPLDPPPKGRVKLTILDASGEKILSHWKIVAWNPDTELGIQEKMYAAYLQEWFGRPGTGYESFLEETVHEKLSDSLPIGVLVTDRKGKIVLYNQAQENITGVDRQSALGGILFKDYARNAPPEAVASFEKALKEEVRSAEHEFDYTDRFGKTRRFRSRVNSLIGPEGQIHGIVQTLEDISRPRLLEQEINRTKDFLKRLLDTTPNPIFTSDMTGKVTFYNSTAEELLGFKSISDRDIYTGDLYLGGKREAEQVLQYIEECDGKVENYETYFSDISGNEFPVSLSLAYLYGESSKPDGIIAIARNLSHVKELESEIRRNEHFLAAFIQNSPDAVITLDEKGQVKTWNQGAEKIFGYAGEEMIGQPLDRLLPTEAGKPEDTRFGRVEFSDNGELKHYITDLKNASGERLVVEAASTVVDEQDNPGLAGRLIIFRDVTLRARLEEVLQENISELSTINEISEALLSSKDLNEILEIILIGVTAGQGLGFNRAFLLLVDHGKQALVGKLAIGPSNAEEAGIIWNDLHEKFHTLREVFEAYKKSGLDQDIHVNEIVRNIKIPLSETDNPLVRSCLEKKSLNIANGVAMDAFPQHLAWLLGTDTLAIIPIVCEHRSVGLLLADNMINHKPIDGEQVRKLHVYANLASQSIERSRLYVSLEEKIADLDKAYQELKESRDKLVRAERLSALGEVATQVAHEIRNPLVSIGGFARSMHGDLAKKDPNKEKTRIIVEEVDRLERYLKDTLTFMRHNKPIFQLTDPNALVHDTFQMIDSEIEESGVEINIDLLEGPPQIEVDPDQIRQVLLNIFRNALEAMPNGGKLTVSSTFSNNSFTISIADTGVGIEKKHLAKLFTAFFTTKSTGSGLGLTISSQIIKNHGGKIGLSSKKGEGTVFRVILPVNQDNSREASHEETVDRG